MLQRVQGFLNAGYLLGGGVSGPVGAWKDPTQYDRGDYKNASTTVLTSQEGNSEMETDEVLNVKVKGASGDEIFYKIKSNTPLKKLMDAYCDKSKKSVTEVRFLFDGTRINPNDTPSSLGMEDNDSIDAMVEQVGS
jgi:small ubiquitin-related modifier